MSHVQLNLRTDGPFQHVPEAITGQLVRPTSRPTQHSFVKDQSKNILRLLNPENGDTTPLPNVGNLKHFIIQQTHIYIIRRYN